MSNENNGLMGKLDAAKEKTAFIEFEVTITETLEKTVTVMAKSQSEAEDIAEREWKDQAHILDADHFKGVGFNAAPAGKEQKLSRGGGER